jgi:hypothetical protein
MTTRVIPDPTEPNNIDRTLSRAVAGAAVRDLLAAVLANDVTRDRLATAASAVLLACTSEDVSADGGNVVPLPAGGRR